VLREGQEWTKKRFVLNKKEEAKKSETKRKKRAKYANQKTICGLLMGA